MCSSVEGRPKKGRLKDADGTQRAQPTRNRLNRLNRVASTRPTMPMTNELGPLSLLKNSFEGLCRGVVLACVRCRKQTRRTTYTTGCQLIYGAMLTEFCCSLDHKSTWHGGIEGTYFAPTDTHKGRGGGRTLTTDTG